MTESTTPDKLTRPSTEGLTLLAQQLQTALMGLATVALCQEGKAAALACLDKLDDGLAEIQLEARQHAGGFELVAWYASHGSRRRLVALRLSDPPPATATH
jgi:hypothetical protein